MAEYSVIKGFTVQTLASDPYTSPAAAGTWASANAMPASKYMPFKAGTQTANLQAGGATAPPANTNQTNTSFEYDGTSWAAGNNMLTTRFGGASFGTQTAAIGAGGAASPSSTKQTAVESYDGTSWATSPGSLGTAKREAGGAGTSTAGLIFGGISPVYLATTEKWNGSTWTEVGDLSTARAVMFALGIQTAALAAGGDTPGVTAVTESFDGTSWTAGGAMNTAREGGGSSGLYNNGIAFGGTPTPAGAKTEYYDGTTWTEVADLGTGRLDGGGSPAGTSSLALYAGAPSSSATEEFTVPAAAKTIVQEGQVWYNSTSSVLKGFALNLAGGAWSSGNDLVDDRPAAGSWGTQTAAAYVCGSPREQKTELFDGTSWTEGNDTQTARNYNMCAGTPAAGLVFGGGVGGSPWATNASEEYDGTSWATGNAMGSPQSIAAGFGIQTAAISATGGGSAGSPPAPTSSEEYDGTSWTSGAGINTGRVYVKGGGTTSSAVLGGGNGHPGTARVGNTEIYNGTAWSEVADQNTARGSYGMNKDGDSGGALIFAGSAGPTTNNVTNTEYWDGTSWTEVADVATGTQELCGAGTTSAGLKMGGNTSTAPGGAVELWNSTGKSIKTFTAS